MKKQWEAILFDLDGTLLPMEFNAFNNCYFKHITQRFANMYEPSVLMGILNKGVQLMLDNDGSMTNAERFWQMFSEIMGEDALKQQDLFDDFYRTDFHKARVMTQPNPRAHALLNWARESADHVALATNPVYPKCAVETRLSWIGFSASDFDLITTYDNFGLCKPNPEYFIEVARRLGVRPEACLMIGNDVHDDAVGATEAGMSVYLVTDCLITRDLPYDAYPSGDWSGIAAEIMA